MPQKRKKYIVFVSNQKGLTIVGLLIAIAIISLSLTTGLGLISRNLRLASITAHEITAAALAQEGVELVRNIRDTGDNWCLANTQPLNGFGRIDYPLNSYAIDNRISTYNNGTGGNKIFDNGNYHFKNSNAGLCPDPGNNDNYITCHLNTNPPFIRKIQILKANYTDDFGGTISYDCQATNGTLGALAVVTVYWSEFWEDNWPSNATDTILNSEDDKTLHRVRVIKCFYDWRPE